MLSATIQNLVAMATWHSGYVHPWSTLGWYMWLCPGGSNIIIIIIIIIIIVYCHFFWTTPKFRVRVKENKKNTQEYKDTDDLRTVRLA